MTISYFIILSIIIYIILPKKNQMLVVFTTAFLMSILAFYLTDKNQYDLIAHRELYDTLQDGGISAAMLYSAIDRSPLFIWIVYGMSFLDDNRFTTAIPTFIGYFILVYILVRTFQKYERKKNIQVCCLMFLMFVIPWQDYSAGVRGALAFSLCCYGIYLEFRRQKRLLGILFYVVPLFIHQASIIFLILRLLVYIIDICPSFKKNIYALCLLAGSMTEFMGGIIEDIANMTGIRILSIISHSFNGYTSKVDDIYEYSIVILRIFAVLIIYFVSRKYYNRVIEPHAESSIYSIYTMLMLLSIGFVWQYDIVCRYTVACMMLSPLILYRCSEKYSILMFVFAIFNFIYYNSSYYIKWEILFQ